MERKQYHSGGYDPSVHHAITDEDFIPIECPPRLSVSVQLDGKILPQYSRSQTSLSSNLSVCVQLQAVAEKKYDTCVTASCHRPSMVSCFLMLLCGCVEEGGGGGRSAERLLTQKSKIKNGDF